MVVLRTVYRSHQVCPRSSSKKSKLSFRHRSTAGRPMSFIALSAIALYGSYVCLDSSGVEASLRMCWPEYSTIWVKQRVAAP